MALLAACRSRRSLQALGELRAGLTCSQKADSFVRGRSSGSRVAPPPTKLTFDDPAIISAGKSIGDLLNAYLVLRACAFKPLVAHAQQLLSASNRLLGPAITYGVVKRTFFRQFCAGEDLGEVWKTMRQLQQHGVAGILDYAAESDVPEPPPANKPSSVGAAAVAAADKAHYTASAAAVALAKGSSSSSASAAAAAGALATAEGPAGPQSDLQPAAGPPLGMPGVVARSYPYASELVCDSHVKDFLSAIDTASKMPQKGFAAIKITALGNPALLERMAASIVEVHELFKRFDKDHSGIISHQEFNEVYQELFPDASPAEKARAFARLDVQHADGVDYVSWCQRLRLREMPTIAQRIRGQMAAAPPQRQQEAEEGQRSSGGEREAPPAADWRLHLSELCLTSEEVGLVDAMQARVRRLAEAAAEKGVRLMIDAEQTYFQPAIDAIAAGLMQRYNRPAGGRCVIYTTYQAYLTDCKARMVNDMERARRMGYTLGCKLVRGAYVHQERRRAADLGCASPVFGSLEETHASYNECLRIMLAAVAGGGAELMVASHNQASIELAVQEMGRLGLHPGRAPVAFGQLLGMADHLTFTLGHHGFQAYKYVPYGRVQEVMR